MNTPKFHSCLAHAFGRFVELRRLTGSDYHGQARSLSYFDRFLQQQGVTEPRLTREIIDAYRETLGHLCAGTQGNRLNVVRQFCQYLSRSDPQGYVPERRRGPRPKTLAGYTFTAPRRSRSSWPPRRDCRRRSRFARTRTARSWGSCIAQESAPARPWP